MLCSRFCLGAFLLVVVTGVGCNQNAPAPEVAKTISPAKGTPATTPADDKLSSSSNSSTSSDLPTTAGSSMSPAASPVEPMALVDEAPLPALVDDSSAERKTLAATFRRLVTAAENGNPDAWSEAFSELAAAGPVAIPVFAEALGRETPIDREMASMLLAQRGPDAEPAKAALQVAIRDESPVVRVNAAAALTTLEGQTAAALNVLQELLKNPDPSIRQTAATALGNAGPQAVAAQQALTELLKDDTPSVRVAAATALGQLGTAANLSLTSIRELERDEDPEVRSAAQNAIRLISAESP